jgi:hypothetical protein
MRIWNSKPYRIEIMSVEAVGSGPGVSPTLSPTLPAATRTPAPAEPQATRLQRPSPRLRHSLRAKRSAYPEACCRNPFNRAGSREVEHTQRLVDEGNER